MQPHSRGPAASREPVLLQALAKRHPGPVEYDPKVGRGDAEFLTNLLSLQLHHLAHHEDAGSIGRELFQAEIHDVEKLPSRKLSLGIAPGCGGILPMARLIKQGIELVYLAFVIERREDRFPTFLADGIDDLVLEYARQPSLEARSPGKSLSPLQCRHQRILHHVLGEIAITKLQDRDTQQISAVGMDEGGEFGVGHTDIAQKRWPMIDAIGVTGHTRAERSFAARGRTVGSEPGAHLTLSKESPVQYSRRPIGILAPLCRNYYVSAVFLCRREVCLAAKSRANSRA